MTLTPAERRSLWRFYYAALMRFDGQQPPKPTPDQWLEIQAAQKQRVDLAMVNTLKSKGLLALRDNVLLITPAGQAALQELHGRKS